MRCSLLGLCKVSGEECPCEEELEIVAVRAFRFAAVDGDALDTAPVEGDDAAQRDASPFGGVQFLTLVGV